MKDRFQIALRLFRGCQESSGLTEQEKKRGEAFLRSELRTILFSGQVPATLKEDKKWIYEIAFPKFMWLYWNCRGLFDKMKRMIWPNAKD